jgi:branched-chain amino acid transport system substrate-binding protein
MRSPPIALALLALSGLALAACGGERDEVVLGVAGPMQVANGLSVRRAAELAVEEINRAGGAGGHTLRLAVRDDERSERRGLEIARDLRANDSVVAVIGHVNSSVSMRAAPIYNMAAGENDSACRATRCCRSPPRPARPGSAPPGRGPFA